jgi:hypothetical protein
MTMGILRRMFGPSRDEVWKELSRQIGASFVEGGFFKSDAVKAHVGEWTVVLDCFVRSTGKTHVPFTRLRAPYVNADGFRFRIYRKSIFTGLAKRLGMQDIEVGDASLDDAFVFQGSDEQKVRELVRDPKIASALRALPHVHFEVKDDEGWFGPKFPDGVDELYFEQHGTIKDIAQLKTLFDLFADTLHRLCALGSAYERDPGVKRK